MTSSPFVLLDDSLTPDGSSFYFDTPEDVIVCTDPEQADDDGVGFVEGSPARGRSGII